MRRLPIALDKALDEQHLSFVDVRIEKPVVLYDCDSLYVAIYEVTGKDSLSQESRFYVRYAYLLDVIMSEAEGRAVYCEAISGNPPIDKTEIADTKKEMAEKGDKVYLYYIAVSSPIEDSLR